MNLTEQATLDRLLDRVPFDLLQKAFKRRAPKDQLAPAISAPRLAAFRSTLGDIAHSRGLIAKDILASTRTGAHFAGREELYCRLHDDGWGVLEIRTATGHDSTRVRRVLRKRGRLPAPRPRATRQR